MTPEQRQSAVDNTRERLEVIIALARYREDYPLNLQQKATDIVDAVIALTKERPKAFPWPASFPRPDFPTDDEIERIR